MKYKRNISSNRNFYFLNFKPVRYSLKNNKKYSVILYLFDSASRYVFRKQMKYTIEILKSFRKTCNIYEMLRYHSSGPRSIHNYLPLFYGKNNTSNKEKIIFEDFEENGYTTISLQGDCHTNSVLYGNTSYNGSYHNIIMGCEFENSFLFGNKPRCIGDKQFHQLYLDYLNEALPYYYKRSIPFISYSSFMEPHEDKQISLLRVDKDFAHHMNTLLANNIINHSLIILMGDHGMNYGPWYNSKVFYMF